MYGCPNRCKHCWIGHSDNGKLTEEDLIFVAQAFRPFAEKTEIFDWYREPDFKDNYRQLWTLRTELSDEVTPHFELASVFRLVRDASYVKWLFSLGVKAVQLTLFGKEATTDFYTGRRNAYKEILQAADILIDNGISPRFQVFVNKSNIAELPSIEKLIFEKNYAERCKSNEKLFSCFVHQGSCDGENEKLYDIRITPDDLEKLPPLLSDYSFKHFQTDKLTDIFGRTERELCEELLDDNSFVNFVESEPTFYIDKVFDVFPNITAPAPHWKLGNLKIDGAEKIIDNYLQSRSVAQKMCAKTSIQEIVKVAGNFHSERLFAKDDFVIYLINKFCEMLPNK